MAEAFINLTEGSGKKAHAWDRTIGANTVLDEFTLPGEYPLATYAIVASGLAWTTTQRDMLQVMAGSSLNVRIRRITITQIAGISAVGLREIVVYRLTSAGTGGTSITARPLDSADAAAGCTAMSKPTSNGTQGVEVLRRGAWWGTSATPSNPTLLTWEPPPGSKPLIIPAGTANGIALTNPVSDGSLQVTIMVEVVETSFV